MSGQVVENQVLVAQVLNQERTSPPTSCKVLHHQHMCLMAQGMENNVSGDESDTTSLDDLVELIHKQKGMLMKKL
jgi:arginyl-tRNA synthetase